jgi:hypothetical protein
MIISNFITKIRQSDKNRINKIDRWARLNNLQIFEQIINNSQAKKWKKAMQIEYDDQIKRKTFIIIILSYDVKSIIDK